MSFTKLIINKAAPLPKVESFTSYLFIGPHPDDIEIGAGATVAKLVSMGKNVSFLICTDGRYGGTAYTAEELIEVRKKEAIASAAHLGVTDVHFLDLSDGGLYSEKKLLKKMAKVIGTVQPDMIFAPDCDVTSECHVDHLRVGRAAKQLAYLAPYEGIMSNYKTQAAPVKAISFYMTAKPTAFVKTAGFFNMQLEAIFNYHLSQFPSDSDEGKSIRLYLTLRAKEYGLTHFAKTAEGFRVLGTTHMHCLPEAGK